MSMYVCVLLYSLKSRQLFDNNVIQYKKIPTTSRIAWWRHQMETFSALLALCEGNPPVTGRFLSQKPVSLSFDVFLDLRLKNIWTNNRQVGDLGRHHAHYGVAVMDHCLFIEPGWSVFSLIVPCEIEL